MNLEEVMVGNMTVALRGPTSKTQEHLVKYLSGTEIGEVDIRDFLKDDAPEEDVAFRRSLLEAIGASSKQDGALNHFNVQESESLSQSPNVECFYDAMPPIACAYLIEKSRYLMKESMVIANGEDVLHQDFRKSFTRFLESSTDKVETLILNRLYGALGVEQKDAIPPNIVRYDVGGIFKAHFDYIDSTDERMAQQMRAATHLVYLNENYDGGETAFVHAGFAVKGKAGDVIRFDNSTEDGKLDETSLHASLPILSGEKWVLVLWTM